VTELSPAARAHVDAFTRSWLGLPAGSEVPAMPEALARRLLRCEELERTERDQWGNWEFGFAEAHAEGRLWEPDVDRWLRDQGSEEARWPDGRPFAICLSHDVDLMAEVGSVCALCDRSREEAHLHEEWRPCPFCPAFQQLGGCMDLPGRLSEALAAKDQATALRLTEQILADLETLEVPQAS